MMTESDRPRTAAGPSEIEIDTDVSSSEDYDSVRSDLTSLTESIYSYVYENGRTYHAYRPGTYLLPNDEREQDRLDMLHHVFRLTLNGELCQTRLENPQSMLDVGTGTGIWAIEMADEYPSAEVVGVDLSPIQPGWVPPNLRFIIDDVNQEWSFPPNSFDFIHVRLLMGSVEHWPTFLRRCYDHLKPGGRLELSECDPRIKCDDDTMPDNCHLQTWQNEFHRIARSQGRHWDITPELPRILQEASFEKIHTTEYLLPVGTWPKDPKLKEIGRYFRAQMVDGAIESYSLALFTRYSEWRPLEVQILLAQVCSELKSNRMHVYSKLYVIQQLPLWTVLISFSYISTARKPRS
ncbi:S-adenosyl-L-methionine-dependent methyltransferase [Penicillium hispanicum]|uniref:S-adenosyl-L-methionine-dependent methyltransferase n=1 Tax=Penicillium hispanicum TaxID=1080232 RepID=UPI00253FF158|nr:S-adenosyl-L-methionine-dependent methyltransferase [Penicillium hispanicum]KAJ5580328.1 S-adenosyl-L-methionine-dependent methyltransferase [Penicillium hispanicum]